MTSHSVNRLTDKQDMLTSVNRKPREYLTHTERLDHLHYVSNRNRDRANFTNKLENFRLKNKNKQLDSNELHRMRASLKIKNDLKFSLVDIAKTKRRLNGSETTFERHLRDGSNEPVFLVESNRLRRKEHELQLLKDRLEAPNSQILAQRVIDELRNIELRTMGSDGSGMRKFSLLPPILNNDEIEGSIDKNVAADNPESGNDNLQNMSTTVTNVSSQLEAKHVLNADTVDTVRKEKQYKYREIDTLKGNIANTFQTNKSFRRRHERNSKFNLKRYSKDNSLPPLIQRSNDTHLSTNDSTAPDTEADDMKRREKEIEDRLTGLKEKTKFDINRRRSSNMLGIIEPHDSLKSLKCFENFTKLHLKNSGASIVERYKPEFKRNKARKKETKKRESDTCKLPPLNVNTNLLRELKHQRTKHKKESEGLPKLP